MTVRIQGHPINISIIQVYAPTSDAADGDIEDFYETVQSAVDSVPKRDFLIIMGDWNAKIGRTEKSECVGQYGLGTRNERGDKLEEFCMANGLVIGNTLFQHHPRRLWTWASPDGITRNQIDYIMIKKRWRSSLQDVKTRPSADCGSDHQLLTARMKLKLKVRKGNATPARYDVERIPTQFKVEVKNKFQLLLSETEDVQTPNELWEHMKETVQSAAKKYIPRKKKRKQPWITQKTLDLAEDRKRAKMIGDQNKWSRLNKSFSHSVKDDKRNYIEKKCDEIERGKDDSKTTFLL